LGSKAVEGAGDRVVEGRVKTVEGCEPAGFETEEVTWSFEEVGEKTEKSAPDGGRGEERGG